MSSKYLTSPPATEEVPKGIPYIIGNEAAERFSFYGMKAILVIFMTQYLHLLPGATSDEAMRNSEAIANYHLFTSLVYFTPIMGALLADILFGKYLTILSLSLVTLCIFKIIYHRTLTLWEKGQICFLYRMWINI